MGAMIRKLLAFAAFLSLCGGAHAQWAQFQAASNAITYTWSRVNIGGGGLVVGLDISPTGVRFIRTDAGGAYIWNTVSSTWAQILCQSCIPVNNTAGALNFGLHPTTGTAQIFTTPLPGVVSAGVMEIAGAPNTASVAYMMYSGHVLVSANIDPTDTGKMTWVDTGFSAVTDATVTNWRANGRRMAIDPNNKDHVIVASSDSGLFETFNGTNVGGATWAAISTSKVPAATGGQASLIAFDPNSGTTGGNTNTVYIWTNGTTAGVYQSTDAGATYSLLAGSPATMQHMIVSTATVGQGDVWAVDGSTMAVSGNLWQLHAGTWTNRQASCCHTVMVNPADGTHIAAIDNSNSGSLYVSINGGTSFSHYIYSVVATDAPWQAWMNSKSFLTAGDATFDPLQSDVLIFTGGQGIWTAPLPSGNFNWTSMVRGVEELIGSQIAVSEMYKPSFGAEDEAGCKVDLTTNNYPATCFPLAASKPLTYFSGLAIPPVTSGMMFGKASENFAGGNDYSGYSTDGFGATYTPFNTWNATVASNTLLNNGGLVQVVVPTTTGLTTWASGTGSIVCSYASSAIKGVVDPLNTINFTCFTITVDDATHFTLQNSSFAGLVAPVAGKTFTFFAPSTTMFVSWNGAFTVRNVTSSTGVLITYFNAVSNVIQTGNPVCISGVTMTGATVVNGCWIATVVGTATLRLNGATFSGGDTYAGGGAMTSWNLPAGSIAASTDTNIAIIAADDALPQCSLDGGQTWNQPLAAGPTTTVTGGPFTAGATAVTVASISGLGTNALFSLLLDDGRTIRVTSTGASVSTVNFSPALPPGSSVSAGNVIYTSTGFGFNAFGNNKYIAADRVAANTFFAINYLFGLYKWTNCSTPTVVSATGSWTSNASSNFKIKAVPGESGHIFTAAGAVGSAGDSHPTSNGLFRACNGDSNSAVTMQRITGFFEPRSIGFGHIAPGKTYPSIYVVGWYDPGNVQANSIYGIYESIDDANHGNSGGSASCLGGNTWTQIGIWPDGWMHAPFDIEGDPFLYGPVYVSTSYGFYFRKQNFLLKRDLDPAANDNAPMWISVAA